MHLNTSMDDGKILPAVGLTGTMTETSRNISSDFQVPVELLC